MGVPWGSVRFRSCPVRPPTLDRPVNPARHSLLGASRPLKRRVLGKGWGVGKRERGTEPKHGNWRNWGRNAAIWLPRAQRTMGAIISPNEPRRISLFRSRARRMKRSSILSLYRGRPARELIWKTRKWRICGVKSFFFAHPMVFRQCMSVSAASHFDSVSIAHWSAGFRGGSFCPLSRLLAPISRRPIADRRRPRHTHIGGERRANMRPAGFEPAPYGL